MKKLLVGCAAVAAFGVVASVLVSIAGYQWLQKNSPDTGVLLAARDSLRTVHGEADSFVPPLDGTLDGNRVERFLAARERVVGLRDSIAAEAVVFVDLVADAESGGALSKLRSSFRFAREGVRVLRAGLSLMQARTDELLAQGMGEGEDAFLYCAAVYAYLGFDPIEAMDRDPDRPRGHDVEDPVEEAFHERIQLFERQLRNTRRMLQAKEHRTAEEDAFLEQLDYAIERARGRRHAVPFVENVPPGWAVTFDAHRDRLRAIVPRSWSEIVVESIEALADDEELRDVNVSFRMGS